MPAASVTPPVPEGDAPAVRRSPAPWVEIDVTPPACQMSRPAWIDTSCPDVLGKPRLVRKMTSWVALNV